MSFTTTIIEKHVVGDLQLIIADVTPDSSFAISGESFTTTDLGLGSTGHRIVHIPTAMARKVNATTTPDNAVWFRYDGTAGVLQAFWGDNDNVADAGAIEVPDTTNLSTYTARLSIFVQ